MKNAKNKLFKLFFLCLFYFLFANINYIFANIVVHYSDDNQISLSYFPEVNGIDTVITNSGEYVLLPRIMQSNFHAEQGAPMEMFYAHLIFSKELRNITIDSYEVVDIARYYGKIAPVPTTHIDSNLAVDKYILDDNLYLQHSSANWVEVKQSGKSREQYLAHIMFAAARYNAASNFIEIPKRIDVVLKFNASEETEKYHKKNNQLLSNYQNLDDLSDGQWLRISIKEEGLYKITAAELAASGFNVPNNKIATIKVFGNKGEPLSEKVSDGLDNKLNEQEIVINTNNDGSLESIIFYASGSSGFTNIPKSNHSYKHKFPPHYLNYMDNSNYYLLTYGKSNGKRAKASEEISKATSYKPDYYIASYFFEEDLTMLSLWGSGRCFLGNSDFSKPWINRLSNVARNVENGKITYLLSLAHSSKTPGNFNIDFSQDYSEKMEIGASLGDYESGRVRTLYFDYPVSSLSDNQNVQMNIDYYSASVGIPYMNYYELHYPRKFVALDGEISFFTNDEDTSCVSEYTITGFSGPIYGFDVTDASSSKLLPNSAKSAGVFSFKSDNTEVKKLTDKKHFFIASKTKKVASIEKVVLDNLRGQNSNSEVLVITHNSLLESADKFAKYRSQKSGYKVSVVATDKIYNEFSHSRVDLTAIRDYVQYAYNNWEVKPKYLVIWGLGHYDVRGVELKTTNFVPPFQRELRYILPGSTVPLSDDQNSYATDEYFVCVDGDDWFPDLAVGRVPITSNLEGENYIAKLAKYEEESDVGNWRLNYILFADDDVRGNGMAEAGMHDDDAEIISRYIPDDFNQIKLYSVTYPVEIQAGARRIPKVTEDLLYSTNVKGGVILFYTGHGNPNILMHEKTVSRETTLSQFTNSDKLFYFLASSCEVGRFDKRGTNCIGTEIVTLPTTGAIASLSATRVSGILANNIFHQYIAKSMFSRDEKGEYLTIGENARLAKLQYGVEPSAEALMYVILGDPTLRLVFPNNNIKIEEVNNIELSEENKNLIELKALSKVKLKGTVRDITTNNILTDFNGRVILTLNEASIDVKYASPVSEHNFTKSGATLINSAFPVNNGEFIAEFVIPTDVTLSDNNAILYAYAFSEDKRYAKGGTKKLCINAIDTTLVNDNKGPDIEIFFDSREYFKDGDVVSKTPLLLVDLKDETGLNVTGLGIGHKLEAWFDDSFIPIDLTNDFVSSLEEPASGTVLKYIYNLKPGKHRIKVRAWDVFNNFSEAFSNFVIPEDDGSLFLISFAPNPLSKKNLADANLIIRHNLVPPVSVEFDIFDALGNSLTIDTSYLKNMLLTNRSIETISLASVIDMNRFGTGVYYYRIKCYFGDGKGFEKYGKLGVVLD